MPWNKGIKLDEQQAVKKKCLIFHEEVASLMEREELLSCGFCKVFDIPSRDTFKRRNMV